MTIWKNEQRKTSQKISGNRSIIHPLFSIRRLVWLCIGFCWISANYFKCSGSSIRIFSLEINLFNIKISKVYQIHQCLFKYGIIAKLFYFALHYFCSSGSFSFNPNFTSKLSWNNWIYFIDLKYKVHCIFVISAKFY